MAAPSKSHLGKTNMSNQFDLTPATAPGLHVHVPAGHSASEFNNPTDNPNTPATANPPAGGKAVIASIIGTDKTKIRFANPC